MKKATLTLLMSVTFLYFACANEQSMETNIGDKFGRLTIVEIFKKPKTNHPNHLTKWALCVCECGKNTSAILSAIKTGNTKSCGCLSVERATTHGYSQHPLKYIHADMIGRCLKPRYKNYHNYGARGITVCQEWLDLKTFADWSIDNGWTKGLTLDRENNDLGYGPENCRYVTHAVNQSNKRVTKLVTIDGVTKVYRIVG